MKKPGKAISGEPLFILIILLLSGCFDNARKDRVVEKQIDDLIFKAHYTGSEGGGDQAERGLEHFKIELAHKNNEVDIVQYMVETTGWAKEEVLYYLSYRLQDDIFLEGKEGKTNNVLYHFERSFDLKKGRVFNVAFEGTPKERSDIILVVDSDVLNVGPVKMKF